MERRTGPDPGLDAEGTAAWDTLSTVAVSYGYPAVIGAVICGGVFEGVIGLFARYWRKIIAPVVASSVVIAIGYSLFTVGARSFGGGYAEDFGSASNLFLGAVTLAVCLGWNILARGYLKQLSVLAGLVVGYILAVFMGKVDLSVIFSEGIVSLPALLPFAPEFHMGAIFSVAIIFMVSAAETIGDTTAMVSGGLGREIGRSPQRRFPVPWPATALLPPFLPCSDALR